MKTFVSLTLFLFITVINAQETTLTTKSVKLDNLISFVADNFPLQQENTDEDEEDEEDENHLNYQVTFLLETTTSNFSDEDENIGTTSLIKLSGIHQLTLMLEIN